jgi:periplasmic protein TonB
MAAAATLARLPMPRFRHPSDRVFAAALGISILLHIIVLSIRFTFPDAFKRENAPQIEVTLVNSRSETRPDKPQVLAQKNLDGGGNTDADRRAKTPLPVLPRNQTGGDQVQRARAKVEQLEREQQELLTQLKKQEQSVAPAPPQPKPAPPQPEPVAQPDVTGQDLYNRSLAMARLEAQIARQVDEYNKRPRKQFVGARAAEVRFAQYVEDWRTKIERIGNLNYPADARGRVYGSLRLTVAIRADGSVESIEVDRPSGYQILDRAAERIVKLASPYAPFPAEIRRDTDVLVITRTWIFAPGDKLQSE